MRYFQTFLEGRKLPFSVVTNPSLTSSCLQTRNSKGRDGPDTLNPKILGFYQWQSTLTRTWWHVVHLQKNLRTVHMALNEMLPQNVWNHATSTAGKRSSTVSEQVRQRDTNIPSDILHFNFKLRKTTEGVRGIQGFLSATDKCTCMVATRPGRKDCNSTITYLEHKMFENIKTIAYDHRSALISKHLGFSAVNRSLAEHTRVKACKFSSH